MYKMEGPYFSYKKRGAQNAAYLTEPDFDDSGRCAGQPEGYRFDLGGQTAELRGGVAKLAGTETIACSASDLWKCLKNTICWDIPEEEAIRAASYNPAKALGAQDRIGSIEPGKYADFIITNGDYSEKRVFIGGKEL